MSGEPQLELFAPAPGVAADADGGTPEPAPTTEALRTLGGRLPAEVRLGTSSWSFPGWSGLVYARETTPEALAREGLPAYASHPLLRTVGVDRTFYGPVTAEVFRAWADAVPSTFRFLVKAHEVLTLPRFPRHERYGLRRGEENPQFLDADHARRAVIEPLVEGLGDKAGPLVFQFPPMDVQSLGGPSAFADRLHAFLAALPAGPLYAVELRNRDLYVPDVAAVLEDVGVVPVLAGWGQLPPLPDQWRRMRGRSGQALVARWMLPPGMGYEEARELYAPFDRLVNEDPATRSDLAALVIQALEDGQPVYVTINNKAEGSAPVSIERLARAIVERLPGLGSPRSGEPR